MEEHHVARAGVSAGIGKYIPGRGNEQNIGTFFIKLRLHPHTGNFLDVIDKKVEHIYKGMGLDTQMVAGAVTVGHRSCNPVNVQTQQIQKLAAKIVVFYLMEIKHAKTAH